MPSHSEEREEYRRHHPPRPKHPFGGLDEKVDVGIAVSSVHRKGIADPNPPDSREFHENPAEFFRPQDKGVFFFRTIGFRSNRRIEGSNEIGVSEIGKWPRDSAYGFSGSISFGVRIIFGHAKNGSQTTYPERAPFSTSARNSEGRIRYVRRTRSRSRHFSTGRGLDAGFQSRARPLSLL